MNCRCTLLIILSLCLLAVSCSEETGKPASSGRQYQVLVIGDKGGAVARELSDAVDGLPQPEPSFDVQQLKDTALTELQKLSRSIVVVNIDSKAEKPTLKYERNVYASPQIVVSVTAPSATSLREYTHGGHIRKLLEAFELSTSIKTLQRQSNAKAQNEISKMFGISMLIPSDMTASRKGKDFLWLSNNTNEGLENICVYRVNRTDAELKMVRDSVMKKNILGERNDMYMETGKCWLAKDNVLQAKASTVGSQTEPVRFYHGLWDMRNDAMGGPFASLEIHKGTYIIYIEGFVYAPESKKRNKMRRLEACLYSALGLSRTAR